jgi:hypothetical protein
LVPLLVTATVTVMLYALPVNSSALLSTVVIHVTYAQITTSTNRRKTGCKSELFLKKRKIFLEEVKLSWNHGRMNCCRMMIFPMRKKVPRSE